MPTLLTLPFFSRHQKGDPGLKVDPGTLNVVKVGGQAVDMGVMVGWTVKTINDEPVEGEDFIYEFMDARRNGIARIAFQTNGIEAVAGLAALRQPAMATLARQLFDGLDMAGDGFIDDEEWDLGMNLVTKFTGSSDGAGFFGSEMMVREFEDGGDVHYDEFEYGLVGLIQIVGYRQMKSMLKKTVDYLPVHQKEVVMKLAAAGEVAGSADIERQIAREAWRNEGEMDLKIAVYEMRITFETDQFGKRIEGTRQIKTRYLPDHEGNNIVKVKPNMELVDQLVDFLPADFMFLRFPKIEGGEVTEWDNIKSCWQTYRVYGEGHTRIANLAADYIRGSNYKLRAPYPDGGIALTKVLPPSVNPGTYDFSMRSTYKGAQFNKAPVELFGLGERLAIFLLNPATQW